MPPPQPGSPLRLAEAPSKRGSCERLQVVRHPKGHCRVLRWGCPSPKPPPPAKCSLYNHMPFADSSAIYLQNYLPGPPTTFYISTFSTYSTQFTSRNNQVQNESTPVYLGPHSCSSALPDKPSPQFHLHIPLVEAVNLDHAPSRQDVFQSSQLVCYFHLHRVIQHT